MERVLKGDCLEVMRTLPEASVDAVVTDPPYGLSFMRKNWDHGVPGVQFWTEALRVLKPGGHLLAFSGSRTYHRLASAIEDAGFEIRDQIMWVYGSGFPKSLNVAKAIDTHVVLGGSSQKLMRKRDMGCEYRPHKNACTSGYGDGNLRKGADGDRDPSEAAGLVTESARQREGWGTALKPAHEPIVVARKPLTGTVAANVLEWGTGAINVDGCRVPTHGEVNPSVARRKGAINHLSDRPAAETEAEGRMVSRQSPDAYRAERSGELVGRFPANVIHDGSDEATSGMGDAARFFYCAKASKADRAGSKHPTVKPIALMRYLCRLVTPPGGVVLDPFAGSGTTGQAARNEGFGFILIEREAEYVEDIKRRLGIDAENQGIDDELAALLS